MLSEQDPYSNEETTGEHAGDVTDLRPGRLMPPIEFRDVELAFDDQVILDKVSFSVRRGETKIVLGGSGSGKSTIIKLILGLLKPDGGQVFVDGEDITEFDDAD